MNECSKRVPAGVMPEENSRKRFPRDQAVALCLRTWPKEVRDERKKDSVALILRQLGHEVYEIGDGPWDAEKAGWLLVPGNLNWFPVLRRQLLKEGRPSQGLVTIWHLEPLPPPKISGLHWPRPTLREIAKIILRDKRATDAYTNYFLLRRLARRGLPDVLAVSTCSRAEFLAERGIPAHYVPLGYQPRQGRDLGLQRDIDVLFLGECRIPRRRRNIARLSKHGVKVTKCGDWFDPAMWGDSRTKLLNRSKVFLNVQRFAGEFSGLRFILGMANGALVISEPAYNTFPFVPGQHYISASVDEMPAVIRHYLENEEERRRIVNEAYTLVTRQLTMERSVSRLVDLMSERAAK